MIPNIHYLIYKEYRGKRKEAQKGERRKEKL